MGFLILRISWDQPKNETDESNIKRKKRRIPQGLRSHKEVLDNYADHFQKIFRNPLPKSKLENINSKIIWPLYLVLIGLVLILKLII